MHNISLNASSCTYCTSAYLNFFSLILNRCHLQKKKIWEIMGQKIHKNVLSSIMSTLHLQNGDKSIFQSQPEISDEARCWTKLLDVP